MYIVIISFIALSGMLIWYMLKHDHGRQLPVESLWIAFGFGLVATVLAVLLENWLLPKNMLLKIQNVSLITGLLYFLAVGVLEEAVKFIPLALFIYRKPYFKQRVDGVIYFAICGLTFGLCENIMYTVTFGAKTGIVRLIVSPFFHAAATSILGYYLISMKINHQSKPKFIAACVLIPLIHGIYDFGLSSGRLLFTVFSLMLTLMFTLGLFLYFMSANDLDKAVPVKSADNYCKYCGKPNLSHTRFCESCGHQL